MSPGPFGKGCVLFVFLVNRFRDPWPLCGIFVLFTRFQVKWGEPVEQMRHERSDAEAKAPGHPETW